MINLRYQNKLLFCSLDLTIDNKLLHLKNVLIDTGSATTLINSDYIHFDGNEELINVHSKFKAINTSKCLLPFIMPLY